METKRPDRSGWVTGPLADLPQCPPFPEFTSFEAMALDAIAGLFDEEQEAFRTQVAHARVIDRINTIVGFYTRVVVDRAACRPLSITHKGGHFEVEGLELGMGVVLWDENGFLETIEGFTYEDDPLQGRDLACLDGKLVQLG